MIAFEDVHKLFEDELTETVVGMPVEYDNVPDGEDLKDAKSGNEKWARVVVREGGGRAVSCGGNVLRRFTGIAIVSLFYPRGTGARAMRSKASAIADHIVKQDCKNVDIITPYLVVVGDFEDWHQANLMIPFEADQFTD